MELKDPKARWYLAYYGTEELKKEIFDFDPEYIEGRSEIEVIKDMLLIYVGLYEKEGTLSYKRLAYAKEKLRELNREEERTSLDSLRKEIVSSRCNKTIDEYKKLKLFEAKLRRDGVISG